MGVVIPAGGLGERFGDAKPKQFLPVAGVPMLLRAIRPFLEAADVGEVVVPLPEPYVEKPPPWLENLDTRVSVVAGGRTRAQSVANGVAALSERVVWILVHDAARPLVSLETVRRVIAAVREGTSAIAAAPVTDTLKRASDHDLRIVATVDRRGMWRAQTPQGFPRAVLARVYGGDARDLDTPLATDESSLVEAAGYEVRLVEDSPWNLKITTRDDLAVAERLVTA